MNAITNLLDKILVPEWRKAWKMLSVLWNTLCAAAAPGWMVLTDDQRASLLSLVGVPPALIIGAAFIVGIVLRLKAQGLEAPKAD